MAKSKEKDVKKETKKVSHKKRGKEKAKKENFVSGDKAELAKVKWPTKQEVLKYTIATLVFIIVLVVFFVLLSLVMSAVKGGFN